MATSVIIDSAPSELLTFVAATGGKGVEVRYLDDNLWMTQKAMSELFGCTKANVSLHLSTIFKSGEQDEQAVVKEFLTTASDGKKYHVNFYSLDAIIAVGYRVNSAMATEFRRWSTSVLKEFTIRGYVLDKERLKNGASIGKDYFDELLEEIREIRLSERRFYQKITDIYATSIDYDPSAPTTKQFFSRVQNKMHFAVSRQTAPEIIYSRADADKEHMGLTSWAKAPGGKILRSDVVIAKNYLTPSELSDLESIVSAFLEMAENRAKRHIPMTMDDWATRIDRFLLADDRDILHDAGRISREIANDKALSEYEKFRIKQDRLYRSDFDKLVAGAEKIEKSKHEQGEENE